MKKYLALLIAVAICLCPISLSAGSDQPVIRSGDPNSKRIALTFDDGPHPYKTDAVLDILARYGVRATFFVVGENVSYYPEPLKRAVSLGHEIGNHTYHHALLSEVCAQNVSEEIEMTEEIIFRTAGYRTKLFRPPEGAYDECSLNVVKSKDYRVILWTVDSRDWENTSAEAMVASALKNVKGGSILLFHDYMGKRSNTLEAIEILIPKLLSQGYEFVTVSELLEYGK